MQALYGSGCGPLRFKELIITKEDCEFVLRGLEAPLGAAPFGRHPAVKHHPAPPWFSNFHMLSLLRVQNQLLLSWYDGYPKTKQASASCITKLKSFKHANTTWQLTRPAPLVWSSPHSLTWSVDRACLGVRVQLSIKILPHCVEQTRSPTPDAHQTGDTGW